MIRFYTDPEKLLSPIAVAAFELSADIRVGSRSWVHRIRGEIIDHNGSRRVMWPNVRTDGRRNPVRRTVFTHSPATSSDTLAADPEILRAFEQFEARA